MANETLTDLLQALNTVATMNVSEQVSYFQLQPDLIHNCFEGLYIIISMFTPAQIFEIVQSYTEVKDAERLQLNREKVRQLASEIGLENLHNLVEELRTPSNQSN